uniref:Histone H2A C-terminal domain-containing protein n=1 Tax=Glossina morsitans morsitans TaxID=37546 RepID=A0A1B0FLF7_GLOMM
MEIAGKPNKSKTKSTSQLVGNVSKEFKSNGITPRHTLLAIRANEELDAFIKATIPGGGVFPYFHRFLSTDKPKNSEKSRKQKKNVRSGSAQNPLVA